MLRLRSSGRGRNFGIWRGIAETLQSLLYAGGWPAAIAGLMPLACRVSRVHHRLTLPRAPGRRPLKIAFASDLHIGPLTPPRLLRRAFELLAEVQPDVLALGGDYVSYEATKPKLRLLQQLVDAVPAAHKIAVIGNHDLWAREDLIRRALAKSGVRLLLNDALTLPPPHDDVAFVGLDDAWTGDPDPARAFANVDAPVRIVLSHPPEGVPLVLDRGAHLILCGHTHGGQIALPDRPLLVPGEMGKRWPAGLYDVGGTTLYVSRGLGMSDLPLRLFAPPDVAVFEI